MESVFSKVAVIQTSSTLRKKDLTPGVSLRTLQNISIQLFTLVTSCFWRACSVAKCTCQFEGPKRDQVTCNIVIYKFCQNGTVQVILGTYLMFASINLLTRKFRKN